MLNTNENKNLPMLDTSSIFMPTSAREVPFPEVTVKNSPKRVLTVEPGFSSQSVFEKNEKSSSASLRVTFDETNFDICRMSTVSALRNLNSFESNA